jgi:hypothetical protein
MSPAQVREQVRRLREAQGLNPTVSAERFLEELACEVVRDGHP